MARYTVAELLSAVQQRLRVDYEIEAQLRFFRVGDVGELSAAPAYYVEPGTLSLNRRNVASPEVMQTVRILSEQKTDHAGLAAALEAQRAFFEKLARDWMRTPGMAGGAAWLQTAQTFSDAPSGFSTSAIEDGCNAVFGGMELTFSIA